MSKKAGLFLIFFLLSLIFSPADLAKASSSYARIEEDNIWLYRNPVNADSEKLFLLEKSYYIKVIEAGTLYYTVEIFDNADGFSKVVGHVKRSDVTMCQTSPILPLYPKYVLNVITTSANLKLIPDISGATIATMLKNQTVRYYGKYSIDGNIWYYVRFGSEMGYISSVELTAPAFALHPTPLPSSIIPGPQPEPEPEPNNGLLQAILVGLICIPAVVIIFTLFSSEKSKAVFSQKPSQTVQRQTLKPRFIDEREDFNDYDLL